MKDQSRKEIIACITARNATPPFRAYVWDKGFIAYEGSVRVAFNHVTEVLNKHMLAKDKESPCFMIAMLWSNNGKRMCDLLEYHVISWEENPEVTIRCFEGNAQRSSLVLCETGLCIAGAEGAYRRRTQNIEEYLSVPPDLGVLRPVFNEEY